MQKIPFTILCLLLLKFSVAQEVQFGVKGGLNLASVKYLEDNSNARVGWNAGALAEIPIQDNLFIRPELLYSSKGFSFTAVGSASSGSVRLNYIAVPVLAGYRPDKNLELLAGPEFGFLNKAVSRSQGISSDLTNSFRHFDIGFDLGLSYNINKAVGVEARYNYGFKDLVNVVSFNSDGSIAGQGKNGANRVLQIGFYYWLSE